MLIIIYKLEGLVINESEKFRQNNIALISPQFLFVHLLSIN